MPMGPMPVPILPGPFPMRGGRMGGRGLRGGGRMGGGRGMGAPPGTKLDPHGLREYYDLDNPANNRAVLDYGDL